MKQGIVLLVCLCLAGICQAQLVITENEDSGSVDGNIKYIKFTVTNQSSEEVGFFWKLELNPENPIAWEFKDIYDSILSGYGGVLASPCDDPRYKNYVWANDSYRHNAIQILVKDTFDTGCITIRLLDACGDSATDTLASKTFKFNSDLTSSIADHTEKSELVIYPNPLEGELQLRNAEAVSSIHLYNIQGQMVRKLLHHADQSYDLSDLNNGVYIVYLLGKAGEHLSSTRLLKLH